MFTLFLTLDQAPARLPPLENALVYTPDSASDPFLNDGAPPPMVVQVYADSLSRLENLSWDVACRAEALEVHRFTVPQPRAGAACTYLVAYEGPAQDEKAWHAHYLAHHPPLMAKLPGIRQLEVYLPVEWTCPAPWRKVRHMQRNKVAFDDAAALTSALHSPQRKEMRADYAQLPPFSGRVTHFPMTTRVLS